MSDRVEKKLQHVAVAKYEYRHDAEFAAGFLDDAGIPYRLQVDDPALGISIGVSATIWVRGMDEARARDILEVDDRPVALTRRTSGPDIQRRAGRPTPRPPGGQPTTSSLDPRERALSFLLSAGSLGIGASALTYLSSETAGYVAAGAAAILAIFGITGRAPDAIRRLLGALAGNAP
jgi:hypothetical protein